MFDRTVVMPTQTRTEYVDRDVNVTIKRAPTDDSVKLLREMEQAARDNVINAMISVAGDNTIGAVRCERMSDSMEIVLAFKLNGERIQVQIPETLDSSRERVQAMARVIGERVADKIQRSYTWHTQAQGVCK